MNRKIALRIIWTPDQVWMLWIIKENPMAEYNWKGSFAIPMTPFDALDRIDEQILADEIEFCVESGVGGIVVPVMVSEFGALSEDERRLMVRLTVDVVKGRVPVVANCAAVNTPLAVKYAEYCQKVGADSVIAMPPYVLVPDFETTYSYFKAISDAVTIPVWIQNAGAAPLSTDQIVRLCSEIEHVSWVKEEVNPPTRAIGRLTDRNSPAVKGIMGGVGGRYMLTERARGSKGVIHACQVCDLVQRVWDLLDAGRDKEGEDLFDVILPGLVLEGLLGMGYSKEIMVRRGVFKDHRMRTQARPLDGDDLREIDRTWKRIEPYLLWHKGGGQVKGL
jgi:4-hydroxy-tetrahydrodipicolinate synthase